MKKTPELFDIANVGLKSLEFTKKTLPYFEGVNIGQEVSKDGNMKRPCLIVKIVHHSSLLWIIPITSNVESRKSNKLYLEKRQIHGLKKPSALLIHHLKTIDKKRLVDKVIGKRVGLSIITSIIKLFS